MGSFVRALVDNLFTALWLILFARIVLSWVRPNPYHPIVQFIYQVTEPIMAPFRRLLPPAGGIDFSPIITFIALRFVHWIVIDLMIRLGW